MEEAEVGLGRVIIQFCVIDLVVSDRVGTLYL